MRELFRAIAAGLLLLLAAAGVGAQQTLTFAYLGRTVEVPTFAGRVELLPVLELVGAEAGFSPAAGTYRAVLGDHSVQLAPERKIVLVDEKLIDTGEAPIASQNGVAASPDFLDRYVLRAFGLRLERSQWGYRIAAGSSFPEPVVVRPAAADFAATTTLVLTLGREAEVEVDTKPEGTVVVHFDDATPRVEAPGPVRSRRVRSLDTQGAELRIELAPEVGLRAWHRLDNPARVILELGQVVPTPTPIAAGAAVEGPAPIVIDPGHGGDDTGAVNGGGAAEKDVVLALARRLAAALEARGYTVRLTRTDDETRALTDRTALANRLGARAFVSLHANASTVAAVRGAETYYMSLDRSSTDAAAAAIAEAENRAGAGGAQHSPLDLILWDLAQAEVLNESARLAVSVQSRLDALLGAKDRGVKQAPFVVLTGATMPAVLVEVGFLSNPQENRLLSEADYQQRIADAIALGVADFLGRP